jgi:hypothetical protein
MTTDAEMPVAAAGPWNPGILSQLPAELRPLCTVFRPENVFTSLSTATELQLLTGLPATELVAFRPQRLVLHEVLIRVTADFSVPDGSRIEDLGINFREITSLLIRRYLEAEMPAITAAFERTRSSLAPAVHAAFATAGSSPVRAPGARSPLSRLLSPRRSEPPLSVAHLDWGLSHIAACEHAASTTADALQAAAHRSLARVLSALFVTHGGPWGTRDLIESLATNLACNSYGSATLGDFIDPILRHAAQREGHKLLPHQERPVVINTKGPSASGKSTLRPLQRRLAGNIGVQWSDFALISPDIWRKQLLDYGSLGPTYKYAGAFTADELQIIDHKLDGYMARKHERGDMSHLLIDRFRFDSFAPNSDEAGSNLLTRFGHTVYLFFMITPPELLVERAWKRGLQVGRYKAVEDLLAHNVEAYAGIPELFFTWALDTRKRVHYEFLDNSVAEGRPLTVASGWNGEMTILDLKRMLDIDRFRKINIRAQKPEDVYVDKELAPERNVEFLRRCARLIPIINFADRATGRVYARLERGTWTWRDEQRISHMLADPDARAAILAIPANGQDAAAAKTADQVDLYVDGSHNLGDQLGPSWLRADSSRNGRQC